jgi:hypothetical protein
MRGGGITAALHSPCRHSHSHSRRYGATSHQKLWGAALASWLAG